MSGATRYPRLYSPFQLGRLRLPNRFVVPAMTTNFAEPDGSVGDRLIAYMKQRVRGEFGLVFTENIGVHPSGRVMPKMVMAHADDYLPGLRNLAHAVHREGGLIIGQLSHAGRQTKSRITGGELVAPSPIPCPLNREMPRELDLDGIKEMETAFIRAAVRLAEAGFDGIEIHGAHGYLVGAFLSRYSNKRTDAYGGSLENRMRFLLNILAGIRKQLGEEYPLIVRISAEEFVEDGLDPEQSIEIGKGLSRAGVCGLSVSVGVYESFNRLSMITGEPEGQWLDLAGEVRSGTGLAVIGVGRVKRPEVAERALRDEMIDLAAFGRAAIADPDIPVKTRRGAETDIMWCLGCNVCLGRSARPETICPVNPLVGREYEIDFTAAAERKTINILGSSLSALTAAWAAARRGHAVAVECDGEAPGGMQRWRARVPGEEEYAETIEAAVRRAQEAGVVFGSADPAADLTWQVRRYQPVQSESGAGIADTVSSYAVLGGDVRPGRRTRVAVIGSDLSATEAAIVMAAGGAEVALFSPDKDVAMDAHPGYREASRRLLSKMNATVFASSNAATDPDSIGDDRELLVYGHSPELGYDDPDSWVFPFAQRRADAFIDDAYEPGRMTAGVYDAFDLAMKFDRPTGNSAKSSRPPAV